MQIQNPAADVCRNDGGVLHGVEMSSEELDNLDRQIRESRLRLEFAKSFLREVQNDGVTGLDHDAAMSIAERAVADAEAEYAGAQELLTKAIEAQHRGLSAGRLSAADQAP
jgi:hypothetical protein